ncbi:hypothetical protein Dsin_001904 [Dipteronia sinensis]|uniref:RRM domain-containing protein n=1 Tax=Dipteronia sinensis TaxID=43782 RepID=A0AAE0B4V5_9ROSI|nr:hypothetical protein Dsin_001904 [Dipteronia sinensis]
MMREKVSVRSPWSFGFGGNGFEDSEGQGVRKHFPGRKDFRENLVSIFIDNVNPKVDVACLWGIFKVFGRVRDVFLSTQKRSRLRFYDFIRFDSLEEASRVAKKVDGMHVYGWPIRAKIAEHGWKSRNNPGFRRKDARQVVKEMSRRSSDSRWSDDNQTDHRSFTEALKGPSQLFNDRTKDKVEKRFSVKWEKHRSNDSWLIEG